VRESARERQKANAGPNEKAFNYIKKVIFVTVASCRLCFSLLLLLQLLLVLLLKCSLHYANIRRATPMRAHCQREWFCFNSAADYRACIVIAVCWNIKKCAMHYFAFFRKLTETNKALF